MKQTPLKRGSGLARRTPLRARVRRAAASPGKRAWDEPQAGFCECGCLRPSWRLARHHVLLRQIVRRERPAAQWDLRNSMLLHPDCHFAHHSGARKIPIVRVPEEALAFAVDVLGEASAADYFRRRYAP